MTAEAQVVTEVAEVYEKCGSGTDPTRMDGINGVGGNVGPADAGAGGDGVVVDNSHGFVSRGSNGASEDHADEVVPSEESEVLVESEAVGGPFDSGGVNVANGGVEHSLSEGNGSVVVRVSEVVCVQNCGFLRKDGVDEEVRVAMASTDSVERSDGVVESAEEKEIESSENGQSLVPGADSVDLPNGVLARLEVSVPPCEDKLTEVMVLEADTEAVGGKEAVASLSPSINDDENEEIKVVNPQAFDAMPRGEDSHLLVPEVVAELKVAEQSEIVLPSINHTADADKEIKESNVEALDELLEGQDSQKREILDVSVESREEPQMVSSDIVESGVENGKAIDEVQGSQNVVLEVDVDSSDRGELNDLSPGVKEICDENKESEGDVLGTSGESAEAQEPQNVVAENAEHRCAEVESVETTLEAQKDLQLFNESPDGDESQTVALGASVSLPEEVTLDNGNSEDINNPDSTDDLGDEHKSVSRPVEVTLDNGNLVEVNSPDSTDDLGDKREASGCQSGDFGFQLNEDSVEQCNSQEVVVNNPECSPDEAEVRVLNSEQQLETESLQQVYEGGSPQVPRAVSLKLGSCQPNDGGVNELDQEGKTVSHPNGNETHVSDTAFNEHVPVDPESLNGTDMEEKDYSVNERDTPLEADNEKEGELVVPHISESAQLSHEHNGSLDDVENPVEVSEASVSDHNLACAHPVIEEAESNGKRVESDENAPAGSGGVATVHHVTGNEASTPSHAKYTEDVVPCSVGTTELDPVMSEKVVGNGSVDGHSSSSYPVCDETVSENVENVDLGHEGCSFQGEHLHLKTKDLREDVESPDSHSVSADVKLDSQVEDSCTLGSNDKLSTDVTAAGSVVLDSPDINKESAAKEVAEIVDVQNAGEKLGDVDRIEESSLTRPGSSYISKESVAKEVAEIVDVENASEKLGDVARIEESNLTRQESSDFEKSQTTEGEGLGAEVMTRPFNFLIQIPRFDDEKLREKIRHAQLQVEEKTKHRDAFRLGIQKKRANLQAYGVEFEAAIAEEREARRLVKMKRAEIESVQSLLNKVKNAISVDEIHVQIHRMEHILQHETVPLKEEKQIIREMKRLNQLRDQLSSSNGKEEEVEDARVQKDQIEDRLKVFKKELDSLKNKVLRAEAVATTARRKYEEENKRFKELQNQFKAADEIRQGAYSQLLSLRRELFEKNNQFRIYKNDSAVASDYALNKNREALHRHCVNQVDTVMELWNSSSEFREEYLRCNLRSTLRRLGTAEGRSLGADEKPLVLPSYMDESVDRMKFDPEKASLDTAVEQKAEVTPAGGVVEGKVMTKVAEPVKQTVKVRELTKSVPANSLPTSSAKPVSNADKEERLQAKGEDLKTKEEQLKTKEEDLKTKEELELARKAEEKSKEEEAAKLKEVRRLEEIAKAKEALERKRRIAEKAQMRAELRAQKEAEQKEKEREKRLRKKERKKGVGAEAHEGNGNGESAQSSDFSTEAAKDSEMEIPPTTAAKTKRTQKASHFVKQSKSKSIPPPLRNRNRRKMQQWMWVIFTSIVVIFLFYLGNVGIFTTLRPRKSGW